VLVETRGLTKVFGEMGQGPLDRGLSAAAIVAIGSLLALRGLAQL